MAKHEAAIPNPALEPLRVLVGEWSTVGSHPKLPGKLHGHTTFEWLEGGAFLIAHSEIEEPGVPTGIFIFGSDDDADAFTVLYFDERGVSRHYKATLRDNIWKMWRNVPGFSQRMTNTISEDGDTIISVGELSEDDATWKHDLELTYTRVK
jgi:hypothetical protein